MDTFEFINTMLHQQVKGLMELSEERLIHIKELEYRIADLESDIEDLTFELDGAEGEIDDLRCDIDNLEEELDEYR